MSLFPYLNFPHRFLSFFNLWLAHKCNSRRWRPRLSFLFIWWWNLWTTSLLRSLWWLPKCFNPISYISKCWCLARQIACWFFRSDSKLRRTFRDEFLFRLSFFKFFNLRIRITMIFKRRVWIHHLLLNVIRYANFLLSTLVCRYSWL